MQTANVLNSPESPDAMDWTEYYPKYATQGKGVEIADVGCGFGGLLFGLAPHFPETMILGMFYDYWDDSFSMLRVIRSGNTNVRHRICSGKNQSHAPAKLKHQQPRRVPESCMRSREHNEVHAQLLHQGPAQQIVLVLPRSTLQSSQAQGTNCLCYLGCRICLRDAAWRYHLHNHGRQRSPRMNGWALRQLRIVPETDG